MHVQTNVIGLLKFKINEHAQFNISQYKIQNKYMNMVN